MTPFPPEEVVSGATNPPNSPESAIPSGNDGSDRLRADLYRTLSPAAQELATFIDEALPAWQQQTEPAGRQVTSLAEFVAEWLIGFGYRRLVSDDDATVDRVAKALHAQTYVGSEDSLLAEHEAVWESMPGIREPWRRQARAAVRALREAGQ